MKYERRGNDLVFLLGKLEPDTTLQNQQQIHDRRDSSFREDFEGKLLSRIGVVIKKKVASSIDDHIPKIYMIDNFILGSRSL